MVKGSKKSKKSPIFDMEPIFIECPHIHFKADTIDRGILSRQQHMNLLSTPKGYRWDVKKEGGDLEAKSDGSFQGLGSKYGPRVICGRRIRKPEKEYIHNFLAEIWALLTPEMIDRLKEMLMLEFGMSPTEAEMFVLEQKGKNIKPGIVFKGCGVNGCTCTARPKVASIRRKEDSFQPGSKLTLNHACIKDFSNAMASKLMDYFVLQLSTKRDKKVKTLAERILKQLCEITGESCTLNNPKTRMHRILVFAADRLACWFAQNLELKKKTACTCDANNDNIDAEIVKGFQKFKVPDFRIFDTGDCTCDQSKFCHCVQVSKRQDKHSQTLDKKASEYDLKASSKEIMKTIDGSKYTFREKQTQTQTERTIDNIQETYSVDHLETKPVMEAATVENYTHDYDGSMKDTKETTQVVTKGKPQRTSKFTAEPTLPLIKEEDEVEVKDKGKKTEVVEETSKEVEETQIEETLVESVEVSKVDHSRGRSKSVINPESSKRDVSIKRETSKSPGKDYNVDDEKVEKSKSVKDAGSKSKVTNEKEHSKSTQKGPSKIDISKVKSKSAVDALSKIDSEEKVERSESVKNAGSKVDASEAKERSKSPDKGTRGSRMDTFREKSKSAVDVESKLDISGKKVEKSKSAISEAKDKERSKSPEKQTAGSSKLDISRDKSKSAVDAGSNDDEVEKSKLFQANKRSNFPVKEKTGSMGDLLREKSKSKVNVEKSKSGKLDERDNEKERSNSVKRTGSSMIEIGVEKLKSAIFGQTDKKSKSVDVFTEKAKERSTSPLQKSEEVNKKSQKDAYTNSNKHLVIKENVYDEKLSNERSSKNGISGENTDTMKEEVNVSDEKVKLSKSMKGLPGSKSDLEEFAVEESRNDENVKLEKYEVTEVPSGIEVAETTNKSKPRGQSPIKSFLQESLKSFKEMSPIKSIREMSPMKSIREMSPIKSIKEMSPIKSIKEMSPIKTLKNMSPIKSLRGMSPIKSLRELSPLKSLKSLREMSPIKSLKIPKDDAETEEQPLEEIFVGHKSRESQKATQGGLPIRPSSKNIDGDLKEPTDKKIDDGVIVPGIETEPLSKNPVGPSVSSIKKDPSFKKLDGVTLPDLGSEPSGKKLDRVTVSDIETEPSSKKPDGTSVSNIKIEPSSKILDGVSVSDKETEPSSKKHDGTSVTNTKRDPSSKILDGVIVSEKETEPSSKNPDGTSVSSIKKDPSSKKLDGVAVDDINIASSGKKIDGISVSDIEKDSSGRKIDEVVILESQKEISTKDFEEISVPVVFDGRVPGGEHDVQLKVEKNPENGRYEVTLKGDIEKVRVINDSPRSKRILVLLESVLNGEQLSGEPSKRETFSLKDKSSTKFTVPRMEETPSHPGSGKFHAEEVRRVAKKGQNVPSADDWTQTSIDFNELSDVLYVRDVGCQTDYVELSDDSVTDSSSVLRVVGSESTTARIFFLEGTSHMPKKKDKSKSASRVVSKVEVYEEKVEDRVEKTSFQLEKSIFARGSEVNVSGETARASKVDISSGKEKLEPGSSSKKKLHLNENELWYLEDEAKRDKTTEETEKVIIVSPKEISDLKRSGSQEIAKTRDSKEDGGTQANPLTKQPLKEGADKALNKISAEEALYDEIVTGIFFVSSPTDRIIKPSETRGTDSGEPSDGQAAAISKNVFFSDSHEERQETLQPGKESPKKEKAQTSNKRSAESTRSDQLKIKTNEINLLPGDILPAKLRSAEGNTQTNRINMKLPELVVSQKEILPTKTTSVEDSTQTDRIKVKLPALQVSAEEILQTKTKSENNSTQIDGMQVMLPKLVVSKEVEPTKTKSAEDSTQTDRIKVKLPESVVSQKEILPTKRKSAKDSTKTEGIKAKLPEPQVSAEEILPTKTKSAEDSTQTDGIQVMLPELVVSKEAVPKKTKSVEDSTQTDRIKVKLPELQVSAEEILKTKTKSENNSTQIDGMQVMLPKLVVSKEVEPNKTKSAEDSTQTDRIKVKLPESVVSQKEILPTKRKSAKDSTKTEGIKAKLPEPQVSAEEILPTKTKSAEDSTQTDGIQVMLPELVVSKEAVPKKTKSVEDSTQTDRIKVKLPELQVSAEEILKTKTKSENNSTQIDGMQVMLPKLVVSKEVEPNKTKSAEDSTQTDRIKVKLPESVVSQKEILPTKRKSAKDSIQTDGIKVKLPELQVSAEEILPTKTKSAEDSTQTDGIQVMLPELVVSKEAVPKKTKSVEDNTQTDRIKVKLPELRVSAEEILPTKAKSAEGKTQTDRIQVMLPNHQVLNKVVPTKTKSDEYSTQNNLKKVKLPELEVSAEEILPTETKSAEDSTQTDRMKVKLPELEFSAKEILPTKTKSAEDSTQTDRMKVKLPELEVSAEEILPTKTKSAEDSTQTDRMKVKLPELEVSAEEILPTKTKSAEDSTQTDRIKVKLPELEVSAEEILPTKTKSAEYSTQTDRRKIKLPELEVSAEEILPVPEEEILPTKSKNSFDRTQTHGVKAKFPGLVVSAEEIVPAKTKSVEGSTQTERREINLSPLMVSNEDSTHPFKSTSVEDSTQTDREIVRHPKLVEPLGAEINPKSNSLIFEQSSQTDRIVSKLNSEISLLDENTQTNLDNMVPSSQNISELDLKPNDLKTTLSTRSTQTRKKILSKQTSYELVREELVSLPDFIDEWTQTKKTISHKTIITSEINVEEEFDLKKEEKDMLPEMKEESSEAKESTAEAKVPPEPVIKSEMPEEPTAVSDVNILTEEAIPLEVKPKVFKPKVVLPREIQDDILTITSKSEETVEKLEKPHVDEDAVKIEESAVVKISSAHSTEASKIREEVEAPEVIRGSPTVVVPPELPEEPVEPHSDLPKTLLPVTMQEEPKIEEPTAETKIESSPIWSKPIQLPVSPAGKASLSPIFETIPTKEELNNALTLLDYPSEPVQIDQTEREFSKMPSASPIKDPFKDETEILVQPDIPNDSEKLIPPDKDLVKMPEPKRDIKLEEPEVLPVIEIPTSELEKPEERSGKEEPFPSVMLPIQEKSKFEQPDDVKLTASKPTESINAVPMTSEVKKSETNEAISLLEIPLPPETREPTKSILSFSQEVQKTPSAESAFPPVEQKMEVPELLEKSEVTLASDISVRAISKETAKSPLVEVVQEEQKSELITQEVQVEPVIKTPKPEPEEIPVYVKIIPSVPEILTREKPGEIPVEKARSSIPQKAKSFEKLNDIDSCSDEKERVSCSEIEAIAIEECTEDAIERHLLDSCIKLLNWFQGMSLFRVKSVGKLDEECESPSKLLEVDRQCSEEILTKLYSSQPLMTDKEITDTRKSTNDAVKKPSPEIRRIQGATEKVMLASLKEPSLEKTAPQVTDPEKIPEISQELAADEEPPTEKVEPKISDFMERILSEVEEPPLLEISTPEDTEPIRNPNVPQNITAATEKPSIIGKRVAKISEFNGPILAEVNELEGIEPAKIHIEIPKEIATIAKEASTEKLEVKISEVREPTEMPTEVEEPSLKKVLPESIEPIEIPEEPQGIGAAAKESSIEKVVSEIIDFIKPNGIPPLEALPETNESVEPNDLADAEEPPFGEVALEITQVEEEITTGVKKLKKMSDIEIKKEPFQEIDSSRIKEEVPDVLLDKIEPLKEILEAREVNVPSLEMILPEHECRSETQVNEMVTDIINDVLEHVLAQVVKAPSKDEVQVADLHKFPSTTSLEIHIPKRIRTKSSVCKDPSQKNISRAGSKDNAKQTSNSEWVLHKVKEHPLPEDPSIHDIPYDMRESSHVPNFLPTKTTEIEDLKKEDSHDTSIKKEESTERLQEAVRIRSKTSRGPSQESLTKDEANCSSEGVSKIPSKKTVSIISGERYKRDEVPSLKTIFPEKEISEPEAVPSLDVKEVAKSAISLPRISLKERIKVKDSQPPVVDIKTPQKVDQQLKKSPPVSVTEDLPNKDEILPKKQDTSSVFSAISADVSPTVDSFAFKIEESSEGEISEELELLPWPDPTKDIPTKSISVPPPESRMNTIFKGSTNRPSFPRFQPKLRVEHEVFDQFGKGETELYKKIAEWFDNVEVDVAKSDRQIAIGEIIEKKLSGSQHGDGQDVGLSEKIAAWVDREVDKIEKDEIPRSVCKCLKREGPTFHVRRDGYAYDITPISDEIVKTKVAENRSLYSDKTDAMVGPLLKSEFKAWARWACDAVQVAEQWANWIDDTCMKAQLKVLDRKEGPKKCRCIEYEQWQKKVEDDALEWQRNKHLLKKVADFWLLKAQQP